MYLIVCDSKQSIISTLQSEGHSYDVNKTCEMIVKFLKYREEKNVDDIRCDIAMGERCSCFFPNHLDYFIS